MKPIAISLVAFCISCSSLAKEGFNESDYLSNKVSFGIEFSNSNNEFTAELAGVSISDDIDSKGLALQLGLRTERSNTLTTIFEYRNEDFNQGVFDDFNNSLHYFSIGFLKEFPQESNLSPYIRGSLGFGFMSIDETIYNDDTTNALGGKVGAGLAYYPASSLKIHGGIDFQYRRWTPIDSGTSYGDIDINDSSFIFGAGVAYLF